MMIITVLTFNIAILRRITCISRLGQVGRVNTDTSARSPRQHAILPSHEMYDGL